MTGSSMQEALKEAFGDDHKDPRKLLANVWIIRGEYTKVPQDKKPERPWAMIETEHPPKQRGKEHREYKACLVSSKKRSRFDVCIPQDTIDQERWKRTSYIRITFKRPLREDLIEKGERKLDLLDFDANYKRKILDRLRELESSGSEGSG